MANSQDRDEGKGPMDKTKGGAEDVSDTSSNKEGEMDEGRSAQERRVYEEKKAASP